MNRRISSIVVVQHHVAEGPGELWRWAEHRSIDISVLKADVGELPSVVGLPVILLGGPFSANDGPTWLQRERLWVRDLVATGTPVLGICLGAQLLAEALGASIFALNEPESGWTTVRFANGSKLDVLQWHDESFTLPANAELHGRTDRCTNQYFSVGETLVGLQFHPEWNATSVSELNLFFGSVCPVLRGNTPDVRRHKAVSVWFHACLDRWFKFASASLQS